MSPPSDRTAFPWVPKVRWQKDDYRNVYIATVTDPSPHPQLLKSVWGKGPQPGDALNAMRDVADWYLDNARRISEREHESSGI